MNPLAISCEDFRRITAAPPWEATGRQRRAVARHFVACAHCQEWMPTQRADFTAELRRRVQEIRNYILQETRGYSISDFLADLDKTPTLPPFVRDYLRRVALLILQIETKPDLTLREAARLGSELWALLDDFPKFKRYKAPRIRRR
jgi:hypothetical protein